MTPLYPEAGEIEAAMEVLNARMRALDIYEEREPVDGARWRAMFGDLLDYGETTQAGMAWCANELEQLMASESVNLFELLVSCFVQGTVLGAQVVRARYENAGNADERRAA